MSMSIPVVTFALTGQIKEITAAPSKLLDDVVSKVEAVLPAAPEKVNVAYLSPPLSTFQICVFDASRRQHEEIKMWILLRI